MQIEATMPFKGGMGTGMGGIGSLINRPKTRTSRGSGFERPVSAAPTGRIAGWTTVGPTIQPTTAKRRVQ